MNPVVLVTFLKLTHSLYFNPSNLRHRNKILSWHFFFYLLKPPSKCAWCHLFFDTIPQCCKYKPIYGDDNHKTTKQTPTLTIRPVFIFPGSSQRKIIDRAMSLDVSQLRQTASHFLSPHTFSMPIIMLRSWIKFIGLRNHKQDLVSRDWLQCYDSNSVPRIMAASVNVRWQCNSWSLLVTCHEATEKEQRYNSTHSWPRR